MVGFPGRIITPKLRDAVASGHVSGVILFGYNVSTPSATEAMIKRLQAIKRPHGLRQPLLVMVDQEGGEVARLSGAPAGSAEQMATHNPHYVKRQGRKTAKNVGSYGINVDLAPVLDVPQSGSVIAAQHRTFGTSAKRIAKLGGAFAKGLEAGGAVAALKHFPGLGRATQTTDNVAQRISAAKNKIRRIDERPYESPVGSKASMVMVSLGIYTAFDNVPAALSRKLATTELRRKLGFKGASISDSLESGAAHAAGNRNQVARRAASAGTDVLLYTGLNPGLAAARTLTKSLRRKNLNRRRFERSSERVLAIRARIARG